MRYQLEWIGLIVASKLVPLLSRRACFYLAGFVGSLLAIFDRHGHKVALSNLQAAFGDQYSPRQQRRIVRESFLYFARTMLDLCWSPRLTRQNFSRYIELKNFEETTRGTGPERTMMIACCNPFDSEGREAVQQSVDYTVMWYLARPSALIRSLQSIYRLDSRA